MTFEAVFQRFSASFKGFWNTSMTVLEAGMTVLEVSMTVDCNNGLYIRCSFLGASLTDRFRANWPLKE